MLLTYKMSLDISLSSGVVETTNENDAVLKYTENDMKIALKKLRDDILRVCESEAKSKLQNMQLELNKLKYSYELLLLEVEEYRKGEGDTICAECKSKLKSDMQISKPIPDTIKPKTNAFIESAPVPVTKHVSINSIIIELFEN